MRGDHHFEVPHQEPWAFESGTETAIFLRGCGIPRQNRHTQKEIVDDPMQADGLRES